MVAFSAKHSTLPMAADAISPEKLARRNEVTA
jgi:hypothetical protein